MEAADLFQVFDLLQGKWCCGCAVHCRLPFFVSSHEGTGYGVVLQEPDHFLQRGENSRIGGEAALKGSLDKESPEEGTDEEELPVDVARTEAQAMENGVVVFLPSAGPHHLHVHLHAREGGRIG